MCLNLKIAFWRCCNCNIATGIADLESHSPVELYYDPKFAILQNTYIDTRVELGEIWAKFGNNWSILQ